MKPPFCQRLPRRPGMAGHGGTSLLTPIVKVSPDEETAFVSSVTSPHPTPASAAPATREGPSRRGPRGGSCRPGRAPWYHCLSLSPAPAPPDPSPPHSDPGSGRAQVGGKAEGAGGSRERGGNSRETGAEARTREEEGGGGGSAGWLSLRWGSHVLTWAL